MSSKIISLQKACSGKCMGSCRVMPATFLLAVCEGMATLFEKGKDSIAVYQGKNKSEDIPLWQQNCQWMTELLKQGMLGQLVLIGSENDMKWARQMIPDDVARKVIAEIPYPLLSAWFVQRNENLKQALDNVVFPNNSYSDYTR